MIAVILFALASIAVVYFTRVEYPVHSKGFVLITGASTGIGRHSAEHLANTTEFTVLAGVRKESDAESISAMNIPNLQPLMIDVNSQESCIEAIASLVSMMKSSDLPFVALVNNAGMARRSSVEFHTIEDAKKLFEVNFFGVLRLTQLVLPLLRESKGRIVMISSVAGFASRGMSGMYSATKFALEGLSDALRREVAHQGISVSIVQPAYVKSAIFNSAVDNSEHLWASEDDKKKINEVYGIFGYKTTREMAKRTYDMASEPIVTSTVIKDAIVSPTPWTRYPGQDYIY
jgi:short-subunit dehydrogenase